jgi:hypothetical protein
VKHLNPALAAVVEEVGRGGSTRRVGGFKSFDLDVSPCFRVISICIRGTETSASIKHQPPPIISFQITQHCHRSSLVLNAAIRFRITSLQEPYVSTGPTSFFSHQSYFQIT